MTSVLGIGLLRAPAPSAIMFDEEAIPIPGVQPSESLVIPSSPKSFMDWLELSRAEIRMSSVKIV